MNFKKQLQELEAEYKKLCVELESTIEKNKMLEKEIKQQNAVHPRILVPTKSIDN